jgi:lycopene beta-cyclase
MPDFDFIIAGGGVSGLSLAYNLAHSLLGSRPILVIEQDPCGKADHALSFWSDHPTPFDPVIQHSWDRLEFKSEGLSLPLALGAYRYHTLRSADYTRFILQDLAGCPNVTRVEAAVERVEPWPDFAAVSAGGRVYTGQWVFDSRFQLAAFNPDRRRYCSLRQYFAGWEIETSWAAFNPQAATLFDLRTPQCGELRFFYVLPYSERRALVEYVLMSPGPCDEAVRAYIENSLGIHDYRILSKEGGVTPLSDCRFPRRVGRQVMAIGIPGGRVKPSAGYAFMRIQRDSAAIVRALLKTGRPFDIPGDGRFYRLCDATLLQIMQTQGDLVKPIYTALFKNNPVERVLHFLDETASPGENLALMASLPHRLFWKPLIWAAGLDFGLMRRPV